MRFVMEKLIFKNGCEHSIITFSDNEDLAAKTIEYLKLPKIALSGGSTYKNLFPVWAKFKKTQSFGHFFPVDERVVPFDSGDSNWGTAYRNFLLKIGREEDINNFPVSVSQYSKVLEKSFEGYPLFDAMFLGIGDDGHTASLFPGKINDLESDAVVLKTFSPKPPIPRITLSKKVIASANIVITIISGSKKKPILKKVLACDEELPIVNVLSACVNPGIIFIDKQLLS